MSEYTDYYIYQTEAQVVEELRMEVASLAGAGIIVSDLTIDGSTGPQALEARLKEPGATWVAVLTPAPFVALQADPFARVFVLEDFSSWRLDVRCEGKVDSFQFGTDDNYALEWFGANFSAPFVTGAIDPATTDRLARCFALSSEAIQPVLSYDKAWDFLTLVGAPSVQMMDQGIALYDLEATEPGKEKVFFDWELW
jgi:hypothetical protein